MRHACPVPGNLFLGTLKNYGGAVGWRDRQNIDASINSSLNRAGHRCRPIRGSKQQTPRSSCTRWWMTNAPSLGFQNVSSTRQRTSPNKTLNKGLTLTCPTSTRVKRPEWQNEKIGKLSGRTLRNEYRRAVSPRSTQRPPHRRVPGTCRAETGSGVKTDYPSRHGHGHPRQPRHLCGTVPEQALALLRCAEQ